MPLLPGCEDCGEPRDSRSPRCSRCRRQHRTARQTASQRRRRAAGKPLVIRATDAEEISTAADLAREARDALAEWLTRRQAQTAPRQAFATPASPPRQRPGLDGRDYARAEITAVTDLLDALHHAGLR